ncbi:imidazole glycerol phosphate synthase subunit HisH, partial [Dehalococcoidia bacterium]|nr:imidazole glycerol phosphate synthase subunit HisH [Dehalococcoidia bacterium]
IIDYGAGNLRSVLNAVTRLGCQPRITTSPDEVLSAQAVILPGVGAAADTMESLRRLGCERPTWQYTSQRRQPMQTCSLM